MKPRIPFSPPFILARLTGLLILTLVITLTPHVGRYVYALTETIVTMPTDVPFDRGISGSLAGHDTDGGNVTVSSTEIKLTKHADWWSTSYLYKKQLTIKNISGGTFATNTPYELNINTKELYDATKLKSACEDLRVVYSPSSGTHTELTRSVVIPVDYTNCSDSISTTIAFPLQSDLANGDSTTSYFVYYGNSSATNPNSGDDGYNIGSANATLVCPFNGSTTCVDGETPTSQTGAIRYSGTKSALSFDGVNDYVNIGEANG